MVQKCVEKEQYASIKDAHDKIKVAFSSKSPAEDPDV